MLTKQLKVTTLAVTNEHENEIWHNGYSFGMKSGAKEAITHLQRVVNDNNVMTDAGEIKMLIFDIWKQIEIDETLYKTLLPDEMSNE